MAAEVTADGGLLSGSAGSLEFIAQGAKGCLVSRNHKVPFPLTTGARET